MAARRKRMTQKEKKLNAEIRKELREEGILPPVKKRLNRKKYIDEARTAWNARQNNYIWDFRLYEAINIMLGHCQSSSGVSLEAVGVAKILYLAIRLDEFYQMIREQGRESYTYNELFEYIRDIIRA